jgi:hypothetical protein
MVLRILLAAGWTTATCATSTELIVDAITLRIVAPPSLGGCM